MVIKNKVQFDYSLQFEGHFMTNMFDKYYVIIVHA